MSRLRYSLSLVRLFSSSPSCYWSVIASHDEKTGSSCSRGPIAPSRSRTTRKLRLCHREHSLRVLCLTILCPALLVTGFFLYINTSHALPLFAFPPLSFLQSRSETISLFLNSRQCTIPRMRRHQTQQDIKR